MYNYLILLFLSRLLLLSMTAIFLGWIGYSNYKHAIKKGNELMDLMTKDVSEG